MPLSPSNGLLLAYITTETARENFAYYVFHTFPSIRASLVTMLSEWFKLAVVMVFVCRNWSSPPSLEQPPKQGLRNWVPEGNAMGYAVPAAVYLTNNLIYMSVLPYTSPNLLQVCILAKLPVTGVLHHFVVRRQVNRYAWISLATICVGLLVFNLPKDAPPTATGDTAAARFMAPVAGGSIAILSAIASVASERLIKAGDFWRSQAYLYGWGVVLSIVSIPIMSMLSLTKPSPTNTLATSQFSHGGAFVAASALIIIMSFNGLLVAAILKKRDNILKVIGTSASLVTIAFSQFLLYPALRASNFTSWKVGGSGIVVIGTWCYNFWNGKPWPMTPATFQRLPQSELPEEEHDGAGEEEEEGKLLKNLTLQVDGNAVREPTFFEPTATKIVCCALIVAFATAEIAHTSATA